MPDSGIFCSAPWYELHIYWDGALGFCCQESHKIYPSQYQQSYNVKNMSIREWMDSEPMRAVRNKMFGHDPLSICSTCYHDETLINSSRRHRCNQKTVIFTKTAFDASYRQSPAHSKFESSRLNQGAFDGLPIDLHIDLGNYCNLACKMCSPKASSKIAAQYAKWKIVGARDFLSADWTKDHTVWIRVLNELADIPKLQNVHFMGGETLITKKFEDFVDFMIDRDRTDLNLSFVTNGTTFNQSLLDKLKRFKRVGIEVSIESLDETNTYQRQGTDQHTVMHNLKQYQDHCDGSAVTLTLRPAVSILTIGSYWQVLDYCLDKKLVVKSLMVTDPDYLDARLLPDQVKKLYLERYQRLEKKHDLYSEIHDHDFNSSDPNQARPIVKQQIDQCRNLLVSPRPVDAEIKLKHMVEHCQRWDKLYSHDARVIYPELREIFQKHGYHV